MTLHDTDPLNQRNRLAEEQNGEGEQRHNLAGTVAPERRTDDKETYVIPKSSQGRKWALRAGGIVLTAAVAVGGGLVAKGMSGGDKGPAPSQPGASAPAVPGQTEQPSSSASEVPKTSRNPEGLSAENYGYQFKGETLTKAQFVDRLSPSTEDFPDDPRGALKYIVETSFNVCADGGATPADLKHKSYNPDNDAGPGPDALQRDMYGPACAEALFENTNSSFATGFFEFNRNEARMKGITNNEYKGSWEFGKVVTASTNADGPVQMHSVIYYNNNYAEAQPQVLVDENVNIPAHTTRSEAFTLEEKDGKWKIVDVADSPIAANDAAAQKYN